METKPTEPNENTTPRPTPEPTIADCLALIADRDAQLKQLEARLADDTKLKDLEARLAKLERIQKSGPNFGGVQY